MASGHLVNSFLRPTLHILKPPCNFQDHQFSQYKHSSGGKLDAVNYVTSRAAHLVKQSVATHHSGKQYRDDSIVQKSIQ